MLFQAIFIFTLRALLKLNKSMQTQWKYIICINSFLWIIIKIKLQYLKMKSFKFEGYYHVFMIANNIFLDKPVVIISIISS